MLDMGYDVVRVGAGNKDLAFACWATKCGGARHSPLPGPGRRGYYENAIVNVMMRRGAHGDQALKAPRAAGCSSVAA
jgi:hypothetical protein